MTTQNIQGAKPKPSLLRGPGLPKAQTKVSKEHSNFKNNHFVILRVCPPDGLGKNSQTALGCRHPRVQG